MPKWSNEENAKREKQNLRRQVFKRDRGVCAMCLRQCADNGNTPDGWDADHIIPVYAGGANQGIGNLRTLCRMSCHARVSRTQASERAAELRAIKPAKPKPKRKWGSRKLQSKPFPKRKA